MFAAQPFATLKQSALFGGMRDDLIASVTRGGKLTAYRQGETICRQGEPALSVFCVIEGAVKLNVLGRNGQNVVVEIFNKGASFAEALLFRKAAYPVSAVALVDSQVMVLDKSAIEAELLSKPETIPELLSASYHHLHRLIQQIEELKASSGLERVASYILALADQDAPSSVLEIPFEKQAIASMLGITPETLSRAFRRLSKHGIRVKGRAIEVTNRRALEKFLSGA